MAVNVNSNATGALVGALRPGNPAYDASMATGIHARWTADHGVVIHGSGGGGVIEWRDRLRGLTWARKQHATMATVTADGVRLQSSPMRCVPHMQADSMLLAVAYKVTDTSAATNQSLLSSAALDFYVAYNASDPAGQPCFWGGNLPARLEAGAVISTGWHCAILYRDITTADYVYRHDGAEVLRVASTTPQLAIDVLHLGIYWGGQSDTLVLDTTVAEIALGRGMRTAFDAQKIEGAFRRDYGVTLPGGHPYAITDPMRLDTAP